MLYHIVPPGLEFSIPTKIKYVSTQLLTAKKESSIKLGVFQLKQLLYRHSCHWSEKKVPLNNNHSLSTKLFAELNHMIKKGSTLNSSWLQMPPSRCGGAA
jgi:hypothetical protein